LTKISVDEKWLDAVKASLPELASEKAGKFMKKYGLNEEQAVAIRDMYLAAGRTGTAVAFQMVHSPLRLDAQFLDIILRLRRSANGLRAVTAGGGAMPLPGIAAPLGAGEQQQCHARHESAECGEPEHRCVPQPPLDGHEAGAPCRGDEQHPSRAGPPRTG